MLNFKKLLHKPNLFARVIGIKQENFLKIVEKMQVVWDKTEQERLGNKKRKRAIGGGRKYALKSMEEKVLLLLMFYRYNMTHELLGFMFGFDASNVTRLINKIALIFEDAIDPKLKDGLIFAHKEAKKISNPIMFFKRYPAFKTIIVDATEQRRNRPQDKDKRKKVYSGKKKMFANKTQILIDENNRIVDVSQKYDGAIHDKKIFNLDNTASRIPSHSSCLGDLGYLGIPKEYPELNILLPHKKSKCQKELTKEQKEFNKQHAKKRVRIENVIGRKKKFKVLSDVYRGKEKNYNQIVRNIAALVNFNYGLT